MATFLGKAFLGQGFAQRRHIEIGAALHAATARQPGGTWPEGLPSHNRSIFGLLALTSTQPTGASGFGSIYEPLAKTG
jgi:hypothetical protein